jgi:WXXGXW repeat (2 copies)
MFICLLLNIIVLVEHMGMAQSDVFGVNTQTMKMRQSEYRGRRISSGDRVTLPATRFKTVLPLRTSACYSATRIPVFARLAICPRVCPRWRSASKEVIGMFTMRLIRLFALALVAVGGPIVLLALPGTASAQISLGVSVRIAPPALPVYEQPLCPGDGYIWTPGYWGYGSEGYYWVPGTWVLAPTPGFLWTPGYWGWGGGAYLWHGGYWGPHVGFYGGVNYGFGYVGVGYAGGYWNHGVFNYNRSVNNINVSNVHNVYNKTVINNTTVSRVSYNGGSGGTNARPDPAEQTAAREQHVQATSEQTQHEHAASANRAQFAAVNGGRPAVAATAKPGDFSHAVPARTAGAPNNVSNSARNNGSPSYRPPANGGGGNQPAARNVNPGANAARPNNSAPNGAGRARDVPPAHNAPNVSQPRSNNPPPRAQSQNAPRPQQKAPQQPANRGGGEQRGGQGDREKK